MEQQLGQPYLYVEWGTPYRSGQIIPLIGDLIRVGRPLPPESTPDIAFTSLNVSRKHALIEFNGRQYTIIDLESTGGTALNGNLLKPGLPYVIRHGDSIGLSNDTVLCTFCLGNDPGQTVAGNKRIHKDTDGSRLRAADTETQSDRVIFNEEKRELIIGVERIEIVGKKFELLNLLYQNRGRAVSEEEIKCLIWPDSVMLDGKSDVDSGLVKRLAFELRKTLGPYRELINTKKRFGYMLNEDYIRELNQS